LRTACRSSFLTRTTNHVVLKEKEIIIATARIVAADDAD
jgi:hypothetical protein